MKMNFEKELKSKLELKSNGHTSDETLLLRAFKYFDLDNNGTCTEKEFLKTIMKIGITGFTEEDIKELFKIYDIDNSGHLDYKEFIGILYSNNSMINERRFNNENNIEENEMNKNNENNIEEKNEKNNDEKKELNEGEIILEKIRKKLSARGIRGITSIAKNFRDIDEDNSQTIDYNEFKKATKDFRFDLTENEIKIAFNLFDKNNNGVIDYDEFLRTIRGEMNDNRKKIVEEIFNKLDINNSGAIELEDIKNKFNANLHPDVLNGKKTEDEVLLEFIQTFESTYNYLCGSENDGKVTLEEFMEYYENISLSIDDDNYFEMLINNTWGFGNDNNYNKKGWSNQNENNNNNNTLQESYQRRFGRNNNNNLDNNNNNNLDNNNNIENEKEIKNDYYSSGNECLNLFREEIKKRGGRGIIGLARQFKLFDQNNNKTLDYNEFSKAIKELKIELNDNEIKELFSKFDIDNSNNINYDEFLSQLRGEMNEKRKEIVLKAFDKLDLDKSGKVEYNEIKSLYNVKNHKDVLSGKKTEEDIYNEFIETFEIHHNLKKGYRDRRVSKEEFLEYYNNISMSIDDDELFIAIISNAWKLNDRKQYLKKKPGNNTQDNYSSYSNRTIESNYNNNNDLNNNNLNDNNNEMINNRNKNLIDNINKENEGDSLRKRGKILGEKNPKIGNYKNAPFGTDNEPVNYSTWNNPNNMKMRKYENSFSEKNTLNDPLKKLKQEMSERGIRGIMSMRRNFMIEDFDNNKNINLNNLKKYCNDYRIELSDDEINDLFNIFDKGNKGFINYENFINELTGEMNIFRKDIVKKVFYKFNKNNLVDLEDLRKNYNAKEHPDFLKGKKNYYECLAEFLDCFEYHFTLLNNDNKYKGGKITLNEFYDFYNFISLCYDNDQSFENMMINVWGLKNW